MYIEYPHMVTAAAFLGVAFCIFSLNSVASLRAAEGSLIIPPSEYWNSAPPETVAGRLLGGRWA